MWALVAGQDPATALAHGMVQHLCLGKATYANQCVLSASTGSKAGDDSDLNVMCQYMEE
jgi:hypothetical protein